MVVGLVTVGLETPGRGPVPHHAWVPDGGQTDGSVDFWGCISKVTILLEIHPIFHCFTWLWEVWGRRVCKKVCWFVFSISTTLQSETITWDPLKGRSGKSSNSQVPPNGMGYVIVARFGYVYWHMWKSKGKTSPTKWLPIQQRPFPSWICWLHKSWTWDYLPVDGPQNASERRWFFERFRYITARSLWSPWRTDSWRKPHKKWQCVDSLYIYASCKYMYISTFQIDIYDWYAYSYTTLLMKQRSLLRGSFLQPARHVILCNGLGDASKTH